jgi:predicted dehydrogenase
MADPKIGGAILGEACHFVDLLYWLLDSEPVSVYACSLPIREGEPVGQNNMSATFRFADGSIASMTYCTVGSKASAGERVECFAPCFGVASDSFRSIEVHENSTKRQKSFFADKGYETQMKSFLKSIQEGSEHSVGVLDGMRATLCCLKMLESARTGESCSIDVNSLIA